MLKCKKGQDIEKNSIFIFTFQKFKLPLQKIVGVCLVAKTKRM